MPHWILITLGAFAAIFSLVWLGSRKVVSALIYASYALSFFLLHWPQLLTYLAVIAAVDGIIDFTCLLTGKGKYSALQLTEKGKKHFLRVEFASMFIRGLLLSVAWHYIGF